MVKFGGDISVALLKLYFKNSRGEERLVAECETVQKAHEEIHKFLDDHGYKSYYSRSWGDWASVTIDVGSHSEFFILKGIGHNEYVEEVKNTENNNM